MTLILIVSTVALWVVVLGLITICVGLLRQTGILNARMGLNARPFVSNDGLDVGLEAPGFELSNIVSGQSVKFDPLEAGPTILIFVTPACAACRTLLEELPNDVEDFDVFLIAETDATAAKEWARREALPNVLLDEDGRVSTSYEVRSITPFVYGVERGLVRGKGVVNHWDEVATVMRYAVNGHDHDQLDESPVDDQLKTEVLP